MVPRATLSALFLLCCQPVILGQNSGDTANDNVLGKMPENKKYQIMSPQTADFVRYDNTSITETSGRLDLSIPVISFTDPDFDFPISLSYNSAGFKPSETDNFVGRNWMLDFGGSIYREIKGAPDETSDWREYGSTGFLNTIRSHSYDDRKIKQKLLSNPYEGIIYSHQLFEPILDGTEYGEFSSDIYHFRFGNHSGKFTINFDGTVNVVSNDGGHYDVDISKFFPLSYNADGFSCEITISDDKGYKYSFGGNYKALEYQAHSWNNSDAGTLDYEQPPHKGAITGFNLTRITAPNGRTLDIEYKGSLPSEYVNYPYRILDTSLGDKAKEYCQEFSIQSSPYWTKSIDEIAFAGFPLEAVLNSPMATGTHYGNSYTMVKLSVPSRITTDDKDIIFHYSSRKHTTLENDRNMFLNGKYCGTVLDSVELFRNGDAKSKIETTKFTYTYTSGAYPRMFLETLSNTKNGRFLFNYKNIANNLPSPQTTDIDHWGFWRGLVSNKRDSDENNSELIPEIDNKAIGSIYSLNEYRYTSSNREATGDCHDWGLLASVTYPAGGSAVFGYEPNDYSCKIEYGSDWFPHICQMPTPHLAGGVRIKSISLHSSLPAKESNLMKRTWYEYADDSGERSSGTLLYEPRYVHQVKLWNAGLGYQYFPAVTSNGFNNKDYDTDHILYSTITKREELSRSFKPDSTFRMVLSPNSNDGEPIFRDVSVTRDGQVWTFSGKASDGGAGAAYILDRQSKVKVKKFVFSSSAVDSIVFSPADSLPPGDYTIALKKNGNMTLSFRERFPGSGHDIITGRTTVSNYTDYASNPDIYDDSHSYWNERLLRKSFMPFPDIDSLYLKRFTLEPISRADERGKLRSRKVYFSADSLQYSEDYDYKRIDTGKYGLYSSIVLPIAGVPLSQFFHINRVPFTLYLQEKKIVREYDGKLHKETTTHYDYENDGYLRSASVTNADGTSDKTTYRYINDESDEKYEDIKSVKNVRGLPTEISSVHSVFDKHTLSSTMECSYGLNRGDIVLESQTSKIGEVPATSLSYSHFDRYSNALQVIRDSTAGTVYIWGYQGKHIVAKIENADYEDVKAALGFSPETISELDKPDFTILNTLRELLLNAHVWTYTYTPLIGMTSETDPAGITTYYDYDNAGRLSEIYMITDGRKEILKAYRYHLVND